MTDYRHSLSDDPTLITPTAEFEGSYGRYIEELGSEERYPFPLDFDYSNFDNYLARVEDFANGRNLPKGFVQSSTYWLVRDSEILGITNIRHNLTAELENLGGHMGLSIRPTQRGLGLGKLLMQLSIDHLSSLGVTTIHIHCHKANLGSAKTIQACGGELHSEILQGSDLIQRYIVQAPIHQ